MDGGTMTMQMRPPFGGPPPRFMGGGPRMMGSGGLPPPGPRPSYMSQVRQQLLAGQNVLFDGKRMRKAIHRKTVDYNSSVIKYLENRVWQRDYRDFRAIQPDGLYQIDCVPPCSMLHNPMNCVTTKFVRTSTNKFRCPIFVLTWTPEGRRLVTGASSGEFTLWNGLTFNFETILQAHDVSVRAMRWTHNNQWMVTADHAGFIKYWQSNMNNVKMYQGHKEPIRGISFCPTDSKFATCSDDGTVRIWDFSRCHEERILRGHGADVKCVDWHPQKSLVASGSKDNQQPVKLWDPKSGTSLATIHAHKHTVMDLKWNKNGNWLLTASRDHLLKIYDIRNMKEDMQTFKGHKKEATAISWHPVHEDLFVSGGSDGAVMFWIVGCDREVGSMEEAHEGMVWSLAWHPVGHILASGSNDHTTKFWTRNRLGDRMRDKYNLNNLPAGIEQEMLEYDLEPQGMPSLPGMGLEHGLPEHLRPQEKLSEEELPAIPGLDWSADEAFFRQQELANIPRKKVPYARPIPKSFEQAWMDNKPGVIASEEAKAKSSTGKPSTPVKNQNQHAPNQQGPPPGGAPSAAMVTGPALHPNRGGMMGPRGHLHQNQMRMSGPPFMMGGQPPGGPGMQQQPGFAPGQFQGPPPQPPGGHYPPPQGPGGFAMDPQGGMQVPPTVWGANGNTTCPPSNPPNRAGALRGGPVQGGPRGPHQGQRFPPNGQGQGQDKSFGPQYGSEDTFEAGEDVDFRQGSGGSWNRSQLGPQGSAGGFETYDEESGDQDYRGVRGGGSTGPRRGAPRGRGGPPSFQRGGQMGGFEGAQYNKGDNWGDQDFRQGAPAGQFRNQGPKNFGDIDERMDRGGGGGDDVDERFAPRGRGRPIRGSGLMNRGRGTEVMSGGYRGVRYNGPARGGGPVGGPDFRGQGEVEEDYYEGQEESPNRKRGWEEGPGRGGRGRSSGDGRGHKWGRSSGWQDPEGNQRPFGRGGGFRGNSRGRGDFRGRGNFRGR